MKSRALLLAVATGMVLATSACGAGPDPQALYDQAQAAQQEAQQLQESVDKLEQRIASASGTAGHGGGAAAPAHAGPHWTYEGDAGPEHWGSLSPDFALCGAGEAQTPIDLDSSKALKSDLKPVPLSYGSAAGTVKNNGHTLQADVAGAGKVTIAGTEYDLAQFHYHTPSEHTIGGKAAPIEFHLVHKSADGKLAVVGVMGEAGDPNAMLQSVLDSAPHEADQSAPTHAPLDLSTLIPANREGFRYEGSLTTPPCSEGVIWTVLAEPVHLSEAQIEDFAGRLGENARPVQDAHGRTVVFDSDLSQ